MQSFYWMLEFAAIIPGFTGNTIYVVCYVMKLTNTSHDDLFRFMSSKTKVNVLKNNIGLEI